EESGSRGGGTTGTRGGGGDQRQGGPVWVSWGHLGGGAPQAGRGGGGGGGGFTLVEMLVALVLLGVVTAALYRVLVNNQRLYTAQTQRIDLQQNIRAAATILPADLREVDATDGDISAATATSITFRAIRWMGFLCNPPINGGLVQTPVLTMTMPRSE